MTTLIWLLVDLCLPMGANNRTAIMVASAKMGMIFRMVFFISVLLGIACICL